MVGNLQPDRQAPEIQPVVRQEVARKETQLTATDVRSVHLHVPVDEARAVLAAAGRATGQTDTPFDPAAVEAGMKRIEAALSTEPALDESGPAWEGAATVGTPGANEPGGEWRSAATSSSEPGEGEETPEWQGSMTSEEIDENR